MPSRGRDFNLVRDKNAPLLTLRLKREPIKGEESMAETREGVRRLQSAPGTKTAEENPNIEEILNRLEAQGARLLQRAADWVARGEKWLTEGRRWLDSHPLSKDVALRLAKRTNLMAYVPEDWQDAREKARQLREMARTSLSKGVQTVREHPLDTVLIGAAVGLAAVVVIKNVRLARP